ncbi:hypothetical protein [Capnocytophaga bilenii]|jgi:hypothetical protein
MLYQYINSVHSLCAYVVLIVLFLSTINALAGFFTKKEFTVKDLRLSLFTLIFSHTQLLLGLLLYAVTPRLMAWQMGAKIVMKDSLLRQLLVEHPLMNIIAVTLITIGWVKHKKQTTNRGKFGKIAIFYTIALICLLSMIPWRLWWNF